MCIFLLRGKPKKKKKKIVINVIYQSATRAEINFSYNLFFECTGFCCCLGFSLVGASGGYSSLLHAGFSLQRLLYCGAQALRLWAHGLQQWQHTGSTVVVCGLQSEGSVVVAHGFSYSVARGIAPDQGLNLCPWIGRILSHCATREVQLQFYY